MSPPKAACRLKPILIKSASISSHSVIIFCCVVIYKPKTRMETKDFQRWVVVIQITFACEGIRVVPYRNFARWEVRTDLFYSKRKSLKGAICKIDYVDSLLKFQCEMSEKSSDRF
jgi:hypothetical protein